MDDVQKITLKSEISVLKSLASTITGQTSGLTNPNYPVAGTMVIIPGLPMAAQAIKTQNEVITKLLAVLEKVVDAA